MEPGRVAECVKNGRRILILGTIMLLMLSSQSVPASGQIPQQKHFVLNQQDQTAIVRFILKAGVKQQKEYATGLPIYRKHCSCTFQRTHACEPDNTVATADPRMAGNKQGKILFPIQ